MLARAMGIPLNQAAPPSSPYPSPFPFPMTGRCSEEDSELIDLE
jgi:hypothetical protein